MCWVPGTEGREAVGTAVPGTEGGEVAVVVVPGSECRKYGGHCTFLYSNKDNLDIIMIY